MSLNTALPVTADNWPDAALSPKEVSLSIVGLGYVGAVSAACFSKLGFPVLGVDIDAGKVAAVANGKSPIVEPGLSELLADGAAAGLIRATQDLVSAIAETNVTLVMVGTPSREDGTCDLGFVEEVSLGIGRALKNKESHHVVVLRCSIPPGTTLGVVVPLIEKASGKRLGEGFSLAFCPEFLREGAAIKDFFHCSRTVIGATDDIAESVVRCIFEGVETEFVSTSIPAAETVKYVDNVWHATKVAFGNEVGRVCKQLDVDSHEVMRIFVQDTKLNISPAYLRPGFAFGGSCLPKDVRAFARLAADRGVELPLIGNLMASNEAQIDEAMKLLAGHAGGRFGFLGVTFKAGTDDIRESPIFKVIARLMAAGEMVRIHDAHWPPREVSSAGMIQTLANTSVRLCDVAAVALPDVDELIAGSDVLVVSHATDAYRSAIAKRPQGTAVLDLVRLFKETPDDESYQGISW